MKKTVSLFSYFLVLSILFMGCSSPKKSTPEALGISSELLNAAQAEMQKSIDDGKLVGFSTMVIKNGQVVQRANLGFADKEANKPMADKIIFRMFSMTKPVTAVALMKLFDEGKFQLDDKVSKFIPEFANIKVYTPNESGFTLEEQENEMTIRNLLTHTSGISYGWDYPSYVDSIYRARKVGGWDGTIGEKVKLLGDIPLNFQPGTQWKYGLSIDVAGYLVEILSEMPLDEYFKAAIFEPLGMDDAGFFVPEEKHDRLCALYTVDKEGKLKADDGPMTDGFKNPVTLFSGGGGMVATIEDYARFCKMLLNGGELEGTRILSPEATQLILSNQLPETAEYENGKAGYGLAGAVQFDDGEYSWAGMASTNFWINPEKQMIIITGTQLLPSDYTFGNAYKDLVEKAIIQ